MLRNYITVTLRVLLKNKVFSTINIAGLAIGISVCLLILQYVSFEFSFDRFHEHASDIYRVANDRYQNGKLIQHGMITYSGVGKALNDDYEEIIGNGRVVPTGSRIIDINGEKTVLDNESLTVDNGFINIFSFPFLAGDKKTALLQANEVVITETFARTIFKYKGTDLSSLLGKTLILDNETTPYVVRGVIADVPDNSHLQFQILISYPTLIKNGWAEAEHNFTWSDFWHYVKLKPGTDYKALQSHFGEFSQRHFQGTKVSGSDETFFLQPLNEAHLYSDFEYEIGVTGKAHVVWGLLIIAIFILIIAWVNYINLATARAMERAKEVGMRKVSGAKRTQLIVQFLTESVVVNMLALVLAIIIVQATQPLFNDLIENQLSLILLLGDGFGGYLTTLVLTLIIICGIILSGFYPAFVLSSFKPATIVKANFGSSQKGIVMRKVLVIAQFSATIILITGSLVVYQQIRYMNAKDLGVTIDQVLVISPPTLTPWDSTFIERANSFKEELKTLANVRSAATSQRVPGNELSRSFNVRRVGTEDNFTTRRTGIDFDFIDLYNIKMVAGRKFVPEDYHPRISNLHNAIINEQAVKLLGFTSPEDAIGKQFMISQKQWDIVGVISDYHQKSLRNPLEPTIFLPLYGNFNPFSVKIATNNMDETITLMKQKYQAFFPGNVFNYYFLDERFNQQYKDDTLFGKVFGLFSGLAIFIACLGLLGLSAFMARLHTKEIGIRKVLGASVNSIVTMLSTGFLKLVLVAIVVASPVAWWVMDTWLQDFAYRISIPWWTIPLTGLLTIFIAMVTISFQSIKAAIANPINSLRNE
jgi:putative ABC transport system permease protein